MGFFNRKKTVPEPPSPMQEVLDCLHKGLEHSEIEGGCVVLPVEQLTIRPGVNDVKEGFAALYFEVLHPTFEEPFFDMSAGTGKTVVDAIHQAVASFLLTGFCGVRHCVHKEYDRELASTFGGTERRWDVSESCLTRFGDSETQSNLPPSQYWNLIAELLPAHLGNRKHYWVKIYASKQQSGEVICECRINNVISAELTQPIAAHAKAWECRAALVSEKQQFFLTQREETFTPYPYTREQIFMYTDKAIGLFAAANTEEKYEQLTDALTQMTDDSSLAAELYGFLPEICAQNAFHEATYGEQIVLCSGEQKYELYIDQLTSYRWMQERAIDGFSQGQYDHEIFKKLVYSSATCNVLSKAMNNGSKLENIVLTSLVFMVPEDYKVR